MKTLETLLKVAEKRVEEIQEEIAKLNTVMQEMDEREAELRRKIDSENAHASKASDGLLLSQSGLFAARAMHEIQDITEARIDAKKIMAQKQEVLRERFSEQKRYEILLERKRAEHKKEIFKKQQAELDDLGTSYFHAKVED